MSLTVHTEKYPTVVLACDVKEAGNRVGEKDVKKLGIEKSAFVCTYNMRRLFYFSVDVVLKNSTCW